MSVFPALSPLLYALAATAFTWGVTALGALAVFFPAAGSSRLNAGFLGLGGGIMTAASFWSLLLPAIERCRAAGRSPLLWPMLGLAAGGVFLLLSDLILEKAAPARFGAEKRRSLLLVLSVTLHNFPEGMAIGVAFGAAVDPAALPAAIALAVGIGIQNFPEGAAVALPLRKEGASKGRAFFLGQASGAVEPLGALCGVLFSALSETALPFLLTFAAGTMLCCTVAELIPESAKAGERLCAAAFLLGFLIMTLLDVALG